MTILREGIIQIELAALAVYAIIMIFKKVKLNKLLFNLSFGLYIALIIAMCFFPIRIDAAGEDVANNFIPFKSIITSIRESVEYQTPYGLVSVLGNLAMLTPLGIFFHCYIKKNKLRLGHPP